MKVFKEGDIVKFVQDGLSAKGILRKKRYTSTLIWAVEVIVHTMKRADDGKGEPPQPHTCSNHFKKRIGWNVREDAMTITSESETLDEILGLY